MHMGKAVAAIGLWMALLAPVAYAQTCPTDDAKTAEEMIAFLKSARSNPEVSPDCIRSLVGWLGAVQTQAAIDVLVEYLEF